MKFNSADLRGEITGGITAGIVALPLALAFGVQSGMGPIAGMYGAIALGLIASLFGGTKVQISGPTGPMTVVSAAVIAGAVGTAGSLEAGMGLILATFILAGVIQIVLGMIKAGSLIRFIPYPVISGFMSGIGVIIILLQVFPAFGEVSPKRIVDVVAGIPAILNEANYVALGVSVATIAIVYLFPRVTKVVPGTLMALLLASLGSYFLKLDIPTLGDIPTGLPSLKWEALSGFKLEWLPKIFVPGLTLGALGMIDSLLTSVVADNLTKTKHDSNRELIGQGLGNMAAGLFGGLPGAGATMRTVVNVHAGGKSRLSGVVHSLVLLVILLGAGRYAAHIPLAALAGILITVGIGIIDYKGFKHFLHVPRSDSFVMLLVLGMTVFVDLLQAVALGFVAASILFLKNMSAIVERQTQFGYFRDFANEVQWKDERMLPKSVSDHVYIQHLYGPFFFGFASRFADYIDKLPEVRVVVFRMKRVPYVDQTGLYALEEAILALQKRGIQVLFTGVNEQVMDMMRNIRLVPELVTENHFYEDFTECAHELETIDAHYMENGRGIRLINIKSNGGTSPSVAT